jgi:hypothetical protein
MGEETSCFSTQVMIVFTGRNQVGFPTQDAYLHVDLHARIERLITLLLVFEKE